MNFPGLNQAPFSREKYVVPMADFGTLRRSKIEKLKRTSPLLQAHSSKSTAYSYMPVFTRPWGFVLAERSAWNASTQVSSWLDFGSVSLRSNVLDSLGECSFVFCCLLCCTNLLHPTHRWHILRPIVDSWSRSRCWVLCMCTPLW